MTRNQEEPWVVFLEHDCIGKDVAGVGVLLELKIFVRSHELFCVLKARTAEGSKVAFTGAGTLRALADKVRLILSGVGARWHDDKYI